MYGHSPRKLVCHEQRMTRYLREGLILPILSEALGDAEGMFFN